MAETLDYDTCCKLVGQLFLELRYEMETTREQAAASIQEMQQRLAKAESERDDALRLINKPG